MTLEENIKAILECNFSIAREEVIESAKTRIMEQISRQNPLEEELEKIRAEIDALDKWGQTFYRYNLALGDCIEIIDNHIAEIKGEKE